MKEAAENKETQCELLEPRIHEQAVLLLGSSQSHVADKSDVFERVLGFLLIIIRLRFSRLGVVGMTYFDFDSSVSDQL